MKKVFSVVLSLFTLLGVLMTSCSADSESGGGSAPSQPEALVLSLCDSQGNAKTSLDLTYNKTDGTGNSFYVKANYEDLSVYKITGVSLVRIVDDDDIDITSKVTIEEKTRIPGYKIDFASAVSAAGSYKIIVYAQKGSEKEVKLILNLTVNAGSVAPDEKPTPVITKRPENVMWHEGEDAIALTVEATISSGEIAYQWYKDGNPIPDANSSTYTPNKDTGKGSYYVKVSNASDSTKSVNSSIVTVTILAAGELPPPKIEVNLDESVSYNKASDIKNLSITATATEGADIYYLWYKDGTAATGAPSKDKSTYAPTAFGSYYCALYASKDGKTSQTVNSKTIVISESGITADVSVTPAPAYIGEKLSVTVTYNVENANVTVYQWYSTNAVSGADEPISGATSDTYTPTVAGRYYCKATVVSAANAENKVVKASNTVSVTVKPVDGPANPTINNINGKTAAFDLSVKEGGALELTVSASTTDGGAITYEWYKQGVSGSIASGATYSKASVTASDAGKYYAKAINTRNGQTAERESFVVNVTITSDDIGSGSGGFDFN